MSFFNSNFEVVKNRKLYKDKVYSIFKVIKMSTLKMANQAPDYSQLEYVGLGKGTYAALSHPGELVYQFRRSLYQTREFREFSIFWELVSIPESQFKSQMRELEGRIRKIEGLWEYKKLINFDSTELDGLRKQYAEMQRLKESIDASFKPVQ